MTISHLLADGTGIALDGDTRIEVPFTLPQEIIMVDAFHKNRQTKVGRIMKIHQSHPDRIPAPCRHFGMCGGCTLQHLSPTAYAKFKVNTVHSCFAHHGLDSTKMRDTITIGAHKRRRIDFLGQKKPDGMVLGFHQRLNKKRFNVETCLVVEPALEALFVPLRAILADILEVNELVHVFATQASNGIDLLLAGLKRPFSIQQEHHLIVFAQENKVLRLTYKVKKRAKTLWQQAEPYITVAGYQVAISPFCFLQASSASDHILSSLVLEGLPGSAAYVADLFCGRGTLSLPMIKKGLQVDGFECDPQALDAVNQLAIPTLVTSLRNLFEAPLLVEELNRYGAVVINPPRSGALAQVQELTSSTVETIVYVSCSPETFARDVAILISGGYHLHHVTPVDQFLWTPHLELVGVFKR